MDKNTEKELKALGFTKAQIKRLKKADDFFKMLGM